MIGNLLLPPVSLKYFSSFVVITITPFRFRYENRLPYGMLTLSSRAVIIAFIVSISIFFYDAPSAYAVIQEPRLPKYESFDPMSMTVLVNHLWASMSNIYDFPIPWSPSRVNA